MVSHPTWSLLFSGEMISLHCNLYAEMEDLSEFKFHLCNSVKLLKLI
jgi:hypothetical protein